MSLFERNQRALCALHGDLIAFQAEINQPKDVQLVDVHKLLFQHDFAVTYESSFDRDQRYIECQLLHAGGCSLTSGPVAIGDLANQEAACMALYLVAGIAA